jgi:hypothetical protein
MEHIAAVFSLSLLSWLLGPDLPDTCPAVASEVSAYSVSRGYKIDRSLGRVELGRLMGEQALPGFHMQGLTDITYATSPRYVILTQKLSDGRWCAGLQKVSVEFGLGEPAMVRIAREIPEESCRYASVLAHEMRHVGISARAVSEGAGELRSALEKTVGSSSPFYGESEEAASAGLKASLQDTIDKVTRLHIARAEMENAAIDTRHSYELLSAECPGSPD